MSDADEFLVALGELLERFPEEAKGFTIPEESLEGVGAPEAALASRTCCRFGRIPGDGLVCLEWCD